MEIHDGEGEAKIAKFRKLLAEDKIDFGRGGERGVGRYPGVLREVRVRGESGLKRMESEKKNFWDKKNLGTDHLVCEFFINNFF